MIKCDGCHKDISKEPWKHLDVVDYDDDEEVYPYTFCPGCYDKFWRLMKAFTSEPC